MTTMTPRPTVLNGTYTVSSEHSGQHRTFRVHTAHKMVDERTGQMKRIVELMTARDKFVGFGFVTDSTIHIWRRLRQYENLSPHLDDESGSKRVEARQWRAFADMLWSMLTQGENSRYITELGYTCQQSVACCRCNAELTTPESIEAGYGPVCAGKGLRG